MFADTYHTYRLIGPYVLHSDALINVTLPYIPYYNARKQFAFDVYIDVDRFDWFRFHKDIPNKRCTFEMFQ